MHRGFRFSFVVVALVAMGCGPRAGKPEAAATPAASAETESPQTTLTATSSAPAASPQIAAGQTCDPTKPPTILNAEDLSPVDMTSEESVMKVAGHPVLVCTPVRRALAGRIVDNETRSPIADATMTIESWQTPAPIGGLSKRRRLLHTIAVRTDAQGSWSAPAQFQWTEGFLAADGLPFFLDSWCVSAPGYATRAFDPWQQPSNERHVKEVALSRGGPSTIPSDSTRSACGLLLEPKP